MGSFILAVIFIAWGTICYFIGIENGEAKYINRNNKFEEEEKL